MLTHLQNFFNIQTETELTTQVPNPDDCVVLLCDVQEYFKKVVPGLDRTIEAISFILSSANAFNIPIITTEQVPKVFGPTASELKSLLPAGAPITSKSRFSMLVPEVAEQIRNTGRKTVILVGLEAHLCILATCLDCLSAGYKVHLPTDAINCQRAEDRTRTFERLGRIGPVITTVEAVVFQWLGDAKSPMFKKVQPAIKKFSNGMRSRL